MIHPLRKKCNLDRLLIDGLCKRSLKAHPPTYRCVIFLSHASRKMRSTSEFQIWISLFSPEHAFASCLSFTVINSCVWYFWLFYLHNLQRRIDTTKSISSNLIGFYLFISAFHIHTIGTFSIRKDSIHDGFSFL